ncbi:hypothetical protein KFK09_014921 [Dendrobium nobile]|uniref:Glycine-rich protein n=1 Tax=Dendrobium nobile TaxID=94219 RepID=A0A8T3B3E2_DENNO|nr:hypothetical protein KFK09_014921 [Dendrobium nobile]
MAISKKLKALALFVLLSISFCLSFARSLKQASKPKSSSGYHVADDGDRGGNGGGDDSYGGSGVGQVGGNSDGGYGYGGGGYGMAMAVVDMAVMTEVIAIKGCIEAVVCCGNHPCGGGVVDSKGLWKWLLSVIILPLK